MKRYLFLFLLFTVPVFASAQKADNFYKKYYGSIDKYPVVMDLIVVDSSCTGWYYYEKQGIPIRLTGNRASGKLVFNEEDNNGKVTGTFVADVNADGNLSGKWIKPAGGGELKFALKEDYSHGSMKLRPGTLSTSYEPSSEYGYNSNMTFLVPMGNRDEKVEAAIVEKLYDAKLNGKNALNAVRSRLQATIDTSLMDYRSSLEEALKDTSEGFYSFMYTWEEESHVDVVFNERDILCLAYNAYVFSGGAHGNYGTSNFVFDTKTGQEIRLGQIFQRGYREMLPKLLEQQFRKTYEVPEGQSLQDFGLFVEKIEPTEENFFITRNGIGFTYVPYEIGPYAAGQIEIILPYSMINSLLDPKGPVGWAVKK